MEEKAGGDHNNGDDRARDYFIALRKCAINHGPQEEKEKWAAQTGTTAANLNGLDTIFTQLWGSLPAHEKDVYRALAETDRARFAAETQRFFTPVVAPNPPPQNTVTKSNVLQASDDDGDEPYNDAENSSEEEDDSSDENVNWSEEQDDNDEEEGDDEGGDSSSVEDRNQRHRASSSDNREDEDDEEEAKPKKKLTAPTKPRKPQTAYALFSADMRTKDYTPGLAGPATSFEAVGRALSDAWAAAPTSVKESYEAKAYEEMKKYNEESATYKKRKKSDETSSDATQAQDSVMPKRAKSAYMLFCEEKRKSVLGNSPDLSFSEAAKKLGELWAHSSAEEKQAWFDKEAVDRARYKKEWDDYEGQQLQHQKKPSKPKPRPKIKAKGVATKAKAPDAPKRAMSAYMLYCVDKRSQVKNENPSESFTGIAKLLSQKWMDLPDNEKAVYEKQAAADKQRYQKELEAFESESSPVELEKSAKSRPSKTTTKAKPAKPAKKPKRDPAAPKRPLSAFMIFCQEERPSIVKEHPDAKFTELGKLLGDKWKGLSASEKEPYERRAQAAKQKYAVDKAMYDMGSKQETDY